MLLVSVIDKCECSVAWIIHESSPTTEESESRCPSGADGLELELKGDDFEKGTEAGSVPV